jgi:hypothetical protein
MRNLSRKERKVDKAEETLLIMGRQFLVREIVALCGVGTIIVLPMRMRINGRRTRVDFACAET